MAQTFKSFKLYNHIFATDINLNKYFYIPLSNSNNHSFIVQSDKISFKYLDQKTAKDFDVYADNYSVEVYRKNVGKFLLTKGKKIIYEKHSLAKEPNFSSFLFSTVIGYLFYQKQNLVIHASALNFNGSSFFFSGRSGSGKSHLASNFMDQSTFLTEDTCCFQLSKNFFSIAPSLPFIKLKNHNANIKALKRYDTQLDRRNRKIYILNNNHKIENVFKGGIFLKIGQKEYAKEIKKIDAFKCMFANSTLHHPLNLNIDEEIEIIGKIPKILSQGKFYEVQRREGQDFDIKKIGEFIQELI